MRKKIGLYGSSLNPPGKHHYSIVKAVLPFFDHFFVIPCGNRKDKPTTGITSLFDRYNLTHLCFDDLKGAQIDALDLEKDIFTPTWELDRNYRKIGEVWQVVGPDLIKGGALGESEIQCKWERGRKIWKNLNFAVVKPEGCEWSDDDLPPHHRIFEMPALIGRSTNIRQAIADGKPFEYMARPKVAGYIKARRLYGYEK